MFPQVEEVDRDKRMECFYQINDEYNLHGFFDGKDPKNNRFLEIKTSSTPWNLKRFNDLMQWKVYALANPHFEEVWMITCTRDLKQIKTFNMKITQHHRDQALKWILRGLEILEEGDFDYTGGGPARYCFYINCPYCCYGDYLCAKRS